MARLTARWGDWQADGLRMRFRPRSRIGQVFLLVAPWLNLLFVLVFFGVIAQRLMLRPGVVFELPHAPFREGLYHGMTAVMLAVERPRGLETLVFLDDQRYVLSDREDERRLRAAVDGMVGRPGGRDLLLLADRRVPHGDVVALVNLVRETGVQRVNVAVKPE